MTIELKLIMFVSVVVVTMCMWILNSSLRKSKDSLKDDLIYTLKHYKLFRKSKEEVAEVEDLKEKLLKVLTEEK